MDYKFIFTRREVLAATKSTSNQLQYLERKALINPYRLERTVLYSLGQMMAIALNKRLKDIDNNCADSLVYFLANFDKPKGFDYAGTTLYCINEVVGFDITELIPHTQKLAQYTLVVVPDLGEVLAEVIVNAKTSDVIDFDSFCNRII